MRPYPAWTMRTLLLSLILASVAYAQPSLVADASVNQTSYAYGEPVVFRYTVRNVGTEGTSLWGSSSCVLRFEIPDLDLTQMCTTDDSPISLGPSGAVTWEWTLDPADLGFPLADGTQTITGHVGGLCGATRETRTTCPDLAAAATFEAPRYLGGFLSLAYPASASESVDVLRQQLHGENLNSFISDDLVSARWHVTGIALDAAVDSLNTSGLVTFAEAVREVPDPAKLFTSTQASPTASLLSVPVPNPTTGEATIALRLDASETVTVEVVDALGRRVQRIYEGPLAAGADHAFEVGAGLAAGVYVVRVTGETVRQSRQFVVAR